MSLERPPAETPALYAQDGKGYEAVVHAHYFIAGCDWLVTEYDAAQDLAFGWACLNGDRQNAELGYVSLLELEEVRVQRTIMLHTTADEPTPLEVEFPVEREEGWRPCTIREAIALLDQRQGKE